MKRIVLLSFFLGLVSGIVFAQSEYRMAALSGSTFNYVNSNASGQLLTAQGMATQTPVTGYIPTVALAALNTSTGKFEYLHIDSNGNLLVSGSGGSFPVSKSILATDSSGSVIAGTFPWSCQPHFGDGVNALAPGNWPQTACYNDTGQTITLTGIKCYTDLNTSGIGSVSDITTSGGSHLTSGGGTCSNTFAAITQSSNTTIPPGQWLTVVLFLDGTTMQATVVLTGTHP